MRRHTPAPPAAALAAAAVLLAAGCAPRVRPLGAPTPLAVVPRAELPPERQRLDFRWEYRDGDVLARGEGVARVAPPDSVRLDLFVDGGLGGGTAVVVGNDVFTPAGDGVERFIPPPALLWGALGRLAVPPAADTVARVDGTVLRADIGRGESWRATFDGQRLTRVEHVDRGRLVEWVSRQADGAVRYERPLARRSLSLNITRTQRAPEFDAAIWNH
jgi:hypothetical protein